MYNPESVLENETHKILWNFEIQTDHVVSARQPDLVRVKKKKKKKAKKWTSGIVNFSVPADHRVGIKEKRKERWIPIPFENK